MSSTDITEIWPGFLYLCGRRGSENESLLKDLNISLIVNVTPYPPRFPASFSYVNVPVNDLAEENISVHFDPIFAAIEDARASDRRVLVHCQAGASRSATVVLAYLMKFHNMKLAEAHAHVKRLRPQTRPNDGFWWQLIEFESGIYDGVNTVTMEPDGRGGMWPSVYAEKQRQKQERANARLPLA